MNNNVYFHKKFERKNCIVGYYEINTVIIIIIIFKVLDFVYFVYIIYIIFNK